QARDGSLLLALDAVEQHHVWLCLYGRCPDVLLTAVADRPNRHTQQIAATDYRGVAAAVGIKKDGIARHARSGNSELLPPQSSSFEEGAVSRRKAGLVHASDCPPRAGG